MTMIDQAPRSIAAGTGVGPVHLAVTDGARALEFYRDTVGLTPLPADGGQIRLGVGGRELVVLHPGAAGAVPQGTTGLYHLAIVVPTRRDLARFIARAATQRYPNSPTDHVLTKSDYLWDHDGNGIEVYTETPEDGSWGFAGDSFGAVDSAGRQRSGRDPIDLETLFAELRPGDRLEEPLPAGSHMGHVHLHVGHLADAVDFYHGLMGFDVMGISRRFGAAFVSAGGYHHHLGLNTWAGPGAPPAPPELSGLRHFTVELPTEAEREAVLERLQRGGVPAEAVEGGHQVVDPSANRLQLRLRDG